MFCTRTKIKSSKLFLGILLSTITLGTTAEKASALTPLDLLQLPLNAIGGGSSEPLPNRNIDVFKENINGNNLNLCVSPGPCGSPSSSPRPPIPQSAPIPRVRGPVPPPRVPQRTAAPSRTAPPQGSPQRSPSAVLDVSPIKLF